MISKNIWREKKIIIMLLSLPINMKITRATQSVAYPLA
jgi:hypothetical protein